MTTPSPSQPVTQVPVKRGASTLFDRNTVDRFWSKVDKRGPNECWPWTGLTRGNGYGAFLHCNVQYVASRYVLSLVTGVRFPRDRHALHSCDNPPCCNPAHLRWGTHSENVAEMVARGRHKHVRQATCIRGHELSGDNLAMLPKGGRMCRECHRIRDRARYHRLKENARGK